MRVLFVTPYGFDDRRRYFPEFVIARNLVKSGWGVSACVLWEKEFTRRGAVEGIFVARVRNRLEGAQWLAKLILQSDVVHIFHIRNPLGPLAFCLSKFLRRPVIFSEAGLLHDPFLAQDGNELSASCLGPHSISRSLPSRLYHLPLTRADKVVFLSSHNIQIAAQIGLDLHRVCWLPHVVDRSRFQDSDAATVPSIGEVVERPFGLFVGQMKRRKGWDVLLKAVPHVPQTLLPRFIFVSPSSYEPPAEFRKLAESLKLGNRIAYFGKISNANLHNFYQNCEVILIPSRYEGFGLAMVEAFEASKPAIASNVVALNETIKHSVNGYLVCPNNHKALADGIIEVLQNEQLRHRMVEGGLRTLKEFQIEKWLARWMDVYLSVVKA